MEVKPISSDRIRWGGSIRHFPALDGLRGLAILLVFAFHCFPQPAGEFLAADVLLTLKSSFWFGVDLFFVLSGYLITGILVDTREAKNRVVAFYARRTLRIFPLYYGVVLLVFGGAELLGAVSRIGLDGTASLPWFLVYGFNFYLAIYQSWPDSSILNHFWTLCVEEQFYLVWPWLVWSVPSRRLPWVIGATILFAIAVKALAFLPAIEPITLATAMPARMDSFAAGGMLAWLQRNIPVARMTRWFRCVFYGAAVLLALLALPQRQLSLETPIGLLVVAPLLAAFFSALVHLSLHPSRELLWLPYAFRMAPLRWLGKYSYGIYVYHWLVWFALVRTEIFGGWVRSPWENTAITASATLLLAWVSFHCLEKPFLHLKARFQATKEG